MNKICPECRIIVAGGRFCPDCRQIELLDVADPNTSPYLAGKGAEIRSLYDARLFMVLTLLSILAGILSGVALLSYSKAQGWGIGGKLLAIAALLIVPWITGYGGLFLLRRLSVFLRGVKKAIFRIPSVRDFLRSYNKARRF